jgi:AcrR family transcriptional regulator
VPGAFGNLYERYLKKVPSQSRSRSVVDAIMLAAMQRLSTGDDDEVTVQEVAARAGVSVGSLYDYFRDRRSLFASIGAKLTEDNLAAFEAVLESTKGMPLRALVEALIDHTFTTYMKTPRLYRAAMRVVYRTGLVPLLAEGNTIFARSFAQKLRERGDVHHEDLERTAYLVVNAVLGVIHTLLWQDEPPHTLDALRDGVVTMILDHLEARHPA